MEHGMLSDRECVERCLSGDKKVFGTLFDRYYVSFYDFLQKTNNCLDKEDVVQETFVIAYKNLPKLKNPDKFGAWCWGIMRNVIKQQKQIEKRNGSKLTSAGSLVQKTTDGFTPVDTLIHTEELLNLDQAIKRLTFRQREVLELRLNGEKLEEIAIIHGVDKSTTSRLLKDVYVILRKSMEE